MLYDIAFLIFSLFYLPTLIFKGKLHRDFLERFGVYDKNKKTLLNSAKGTIWIQAVSVGEVALCSSLIPLLKEKFPDGGIVLSTITKTGSELAKKIFLGDAIIIYFPLDFRFIVKRVVALIRPKIYVMVETEIWPNLLKEIRQRDIASILINGRISDKSFVKYKFVRPYLKNILTKINSFCMQSDLDAKRILELGAPEDRVRITGNMKFDADIKVDFEATQRMRQRLLLNIDDQLLVAGSTHRGEERAIIKAFKELTQEFPHLKLLIAPRHIDRAGEVKALVKQYTQGQKTIVLDTIGQLINAYAIATIVFVGGSLVKHGGQNPIEPAAFEKPIIFGPNMFNFKDIARLFVENRAAIQISDGEELLEKITILLKDESQRITLGKNAKKVVLEKRGAAERNLNAIVELVEA